MVEGGKTVGFEETVVERRQSSVSMLDGSGSGGTYEDFFSTELVGWGGGARM